MATRAGRQLSRDHGVSLILGRFFHLTDRASQTKVEDLGTGVYAMIPAGALLVLLLRSFFFGVFFLRGFDFNFCLVGVCLLACPCSATEPSEKRGGIRTASWGPLASQNSVCVCAVRKHARAWDVARYSRQRGQNSAGWSVGRLIEGAR
jgi:hypothetical protein